MSDVVRESVAQYGAKLRPWTVEEYYRAAEKGIFKPGEKLELIDGEVIQKVSPQLSRHAAAIQLASDALRTIFGEGCHVRIQLPFRLDRHNEPEPDLLVVKGSARDYVDRHPGSEHALLVVEVADTTLRLDRSRKGSLYARFRLPDYWIVNLTDSRVEVFREPEGEGANAAYSVSDVLGKGESIAAMSVPNAPIQVADLLP